MRSIVNEMSVCGCVCVCTSMYKLHVANILYIQHITHIKNKSFAHKHATDDARAKFGSACRSRAHAFTHTHKRNSLFTLWNHNNNVCGNMPCDALVPSFVVVFLHLTGIRSASATECIVARNLRFYHLLHPLPAALPPPLLCVRHNGECTRIMNSFNL